MRFLRRIDLTKKFGVSATTLWRWERDGRIPPRRQIGPNVVAWLESDIDEWMLARPNAGSSGEGTEVNLEVAAREPEDGGTTQEMTPLPQRDGSGT